jgi:hypothetical protein
MSIPSTALSREEGKSSHLGTRVYPEWAPIQVWQGISGWGKTKTYEHIALRNLRAKKFGKRTLIHVPSGLEYIESLPDAVMTTGLSRHQTS